MKIARSILCTAILIQLFASTDLRAEVSSQILIKGQSKTFSVGYEIGDIAVADPGVCDYLVGDSRKSLYVNAKNDGETTITLWDRIGKQRDEFFIKVVSTTLKEVLGKVKNEFGNLKGVDIKVKDGKIEIGGQVVDPEDYKLIEEADRQSPSIKNKVHLSPRIMNQISAAIKEQSDVPGVRVGAVKDKVVLSGVAYSSSDRKRAVEIAKVFHPDVLDLIEVRESGRRIGEGDLIELTFHMMEIKKGALREIGVNWAPGSFAEGGGNVSNGSGAGLFSEIGDFGRSILGFVFQLVPKLRFIRQKGDGRVLENPSIIVKNGEKAEIFSGSEVPYYKDDEVQFKKVGIEIEAWPVEVKGGIDLKLTAKLSSPSADLRGAVDTNTISTTALCPFGQSLVLGNIIRNNDVKMKNRIPGGVSTQSALFTLFLSKDFQSNRSEFVIFITPKKIKRMDGAEGRLRQFLVTEEAMIMDRSKREYEDHVGATKEPKATGRRRGNKYVR